MKQNQRETDFKFLAIGILLSMVLAVVFITTVIKNTQHTTYGESYNTISDLRKDLTYNIVIPSFVESEKNLTIGNVSGGVFTISNENFRLCGCEYIDTFKNDDVYFRLCPLGFYDEIEDDRLYEVNSEDENFSLLRIRQGEDYTIFNYLYDNVAYGCIIFEKVTDEKVLALVNLKVEDIKEIDIISKEEAFEDYGVIDIEEGALKALLDKNKNIKKLGSTSELTYYTIGDKTVLIIANSNFKKYINDFGNDCEFSLIDGELWLYNVDLENELSGDNLNYYKDFLLTMESILEAYD